MKASLTLYKVEVEEWRRTARQRNVLAVVYSPSWKRRWPSRRLEWPLVMSIDDNDCSSLALMRSNDGIVVDERRQMSTSLKSIIIIVSLTCRCRRLCCLLIIILLFAVIVILHLAVLSFVALCLVPSDNILCLLICYSNQQCHHGCLTGQVLISIIDIKSD